MSSTRLLVLGVVRMFEPVHGYDVRRELLSWHVDHWANVAPGSIYNALKSMTKDGLLEVVGVNQIGGRPERTTYQLTAEGEKTFQSLVRDTFWTVLTPIDPLMPGLCFFPVMRREELIAALKHRIAQIRGQLEHAEFSIAELPDATTPAHVKELYRLSAARAAAEIPWAEELSKRLERGEYSFPQPGDPRPRRAGAGARATPALMEGTETASGSSSSSPASPSSPPGARVSQARRRGRARRTG